MIVTAILAMALQGCAAYTISDVGDRAAGAGMRYEEIVAGSFRLATYTRIRDVNRPVTIYIDGDIRGWMPSADPGQDSTPDEEMGLRLASLDPSANVVYIAHPCQFGIDAESCAEMEKPGRFYAEQILTSMNRAVDHFVVLFPHPRINIVGYSGGGAIATLIAARRHEVVSLRTIAGNLDPTADNRFHAADAPEDFVDPLDYAPRLKTMPQEHFLGGQDTEVPPFLIGNFLHLIGTSYCVKVTPIEAASHKTGWEAAWRNHAADIPVCDVLSR